MDAPAVAQHDPGGRSKPKWPPGSAVSAWFSDCGRYRWGLAEVWDSRLALVMWTLMNPSVAGVTHGDPTLLKTGRYARAWGFGGQLIANVHAYRATDSRHLLEVADPVGPENDGAILAMARRATLVILAYGQPPKRLRPRSDHVVARLRSAGAPLAYLRLSQDGTPQHPLYLPGDLLPEVYV